jgi:hypothetical protein
VYNGDVVEVKCKIKGDDPDHPITDHAHSSLAASHIWLKIQAPRKRKSKVGYMSVVNLGFPSTNKIQGC